MKKAHKEKGEKILSGLQQGIANESTESIENYDSIRAVSYTHLINIIERQALTIMVSASFLPFFKSI